jgi:hypothetical protein
MSSQPAAKSTSQLSFPLFPLLPTELRIQIWEAHLTLSFTEPRIIPPDPARTGYLTPLVAVNREAYRTTHYWALNQGHRDGVRPWNWVHKEHPPRFQLRIRQTHSRNRYFYRASNPERDVLFFLQDINYRHWAIAYPDEDSDSSGDDNGNSSDYERALLTLLSSLLSAPPPPELQRPQRHFKHIALVTHQLQQGADDTWLAEFWLAFRMEVLFVVLATKESYARLLPSFRYGSPVGHWFAREDLWDWDADLNANADSDSTEGHSQAAESLLESYGKTHTVVVGASIWDPETRQFTREGCRGRINGVDIDACARESAEWISLHSPPLAQALIRENVSRFEVRYVY